MKRLSVFTLMFLLFAISSYAGETVGTMQSVFRDDFPGTSINTGKWEAPVIAGAATYSVSSSNLVVNLTTGATDSFTLTSKEPITLPNRVQFGVLLSARSANQEVYVQVVSQAFKNSGGTAGHVAQWKFNGAVATTANTRTANNGTYGTDTARTIATSATASLFQIILGMDDVRFAQTTVDNAGAKSGVFLHTVKIPDPNEAYYLQIVCKNTGASTALTATFDSAFAKSLLEFQTEITAGTGDTVAALAMPVNVVTNGTMSAPQYVTGAVAHDAAVSGNPVRVGSRAVTANYTAVASGDVADNISTLVGAQIAKPYSIPEADFHAIDQITNTATAQQAKAATAGLKNYVTRLSLAHATLAAAGELQVRSTPIASTSATIASNTLVMAGTYNWKVGDMVYVTASTVTGLTAANYYYILTVSGANLTFSATRGGTTLAISGTTVSATLAKMLYRQQLQTTALPVTQVQFDTPVDGGTGLAIEVVTPVAIATGRIDWNIAGYVAP